MSLELGARRPQGILLRLPPLQRHLLKSTVCPSSEDSGRMLECEVCSCWSHCECVSLTVALAPIFPFDCPYCVKFLLARVSALSSEVSALQAQVSSLTVSAVTLDDQSPLSTEVQYVSVSLVQLTTSKEALQAKCGSQSTIQVGDHPSQEVQTSGPPTYPKPKLLSGILIGGIMLLSLALGRILFIPIV